MHNFEDAAESLHILMKILDLQAPPEFNVANLGG